MGSTASLITAGVGTGISVLGQLSAGHQQEMASVVDAATIAQTGEMNAQLIEQGSELKNLTATWGKPGRIVIQQPDPLPLSILGILLNGPVGK